MSKHVLKMTSAQRDGEAKKWERGFSFDETRPLSKRSGALRNIAKRGRGRPRKPASERAKRVLISLDPHLFALVEAFASSNRLDRSKLFAVSVQAFMAASERDPTDDAEKGARCTTERREGCDGCALSAGFDQPADLSPRAGRINTGSEWVTIDTLEGTIDGSLSYHYDVFADVVYLRLVSEMQTPTIGEESNEGLIELRDETTHRLMGLTIVSWWKRFGGGRELPDSIQEIQRHIPPWSAKVAS